MWQEGEGSFYIKGAQYVISPGSPQGGGSVLLMHLNTEEVQDMISNLCDNPASYFYQYLQRYKLFTDRCARQCVTTWFSNPLWVTNSIFNILTNKVSTQSKSAQVVYHKGMAKMGCVEITTHLMKEINLWMKIWDQPSLLDQLTKMFNISGVPTSGFSCINSAASVLTSTSHTTGGNASLRSVNTAVITRELDSKRDERSLLMMRLCELSPSHPVFNEDGFNEDTDFLSDTLENDVIQAILYRATCQQINCLHTLIQEVKAVNTAMEADASASSEAPNGTPPPNSGRAATSNPTARGSMAVDGSGVVQGS